MEIGYRLCGADDAPAAAGLAGMLWPGCDQTELVKEYGQFISAGSMACPLALFRGEPIGFAQCQLRHDYVEGAHSSPVAYLEGIFVKAPYRRLGAARGLLSMCEEWARGKGCHELASDCELNNDGSLGFHLNYGFSEANRIICFIKNIQSKG
ncbi:MAG: aminoglycoside 6'-N-acetyltransferase [Candidatus Gastranaerophilaceae bacterium]|jgi:aminoglycoside 6'-N-acetyltransferase I|nr:aminoglycoside 6'-N-acetyltransferase [Christensenellales bacterium]